MPTRPVGDGGDVGIQNDYGLSVVGISKSTLRLLESDANGTDGRAYYEVNYNGYYIWIPYTDAFLFSQEIDSIKQSNKNKYGHSFKVVKTDRGTVRGITFFPKFLRGDGGNFFAFGVQIGAVDYNFNIQYPTYSGKTDISALTREILNKGYFGGLSGIFSSDFNLIQIQAIPPSKFLHNLPEEL